jgi:hypothetical protein
MRIMCRREISASLSQERVRKDPFLRSIFCTQRQLIPDVELVLSVSTCPDGSMAFKTSSEVHREEPSDGIIAKYLEFGKLVAFYIIPFLWP